MRTRCRPGDLAVVVRCPPRFGDVFLGRIVRVTRLIPAVSDLTTVWDYEGPRLTGTDIFSKRDMRVTGISDSSLRPLRDSPDPEATTTPATTKETA